MRSTLLVAISLTASTFVVSAAPDIYSFENKLPASLAPADGTTATLSTTEKVHGTQSLRITWDGSGGIISLKHPIAAENQIVRQRKHAAVFHLWLHQESSLKDQSLRIEFGRNGQDTPDCWFDYQLGFTGWRTLMMPYNRMAGKEPPNMDWLRIRTPKGAAGQAHIDLLLPSVQFDRRHASDDQSYQFTRDDPHSRDRKGKPIDLYHQGIREVPSTEPTDTQLTALHAIEQGLEREYLGKPGKPNLPDLRQRYAAYQIKTTPSGVTGRHIYFKHTADIYHGLAPEKEISSELNYDLHNTGKLLLSLAKAWHATPATDPTRAEIEHMIISLHRLLLRSGWHEGHGSGTLHHFGYSSREYYTAGFLTRELLEKHGLRNQVARALQWFNDAHYCYDPYATTHYANLDYFHTLALPQLMALLMTEDPGSRYNAVTQWSTMLSGAIANNRHGNNGGFKEDGTAFHHWGHYPAYETGALKILPTLFRLFSDTPFRLSADAYLSFRKALLAIRLQSNLHSWPRTLSGRHPYSQAGISNLESAFVNFARSGTSDGKHPTDPEVAAVTLRLFPDAGSEFPGITAEPHPSGHWTLPYAHTSIHRRDDWLALARGMSRYVWGSEIYGSVNHYGRYQSHGTLEILPLTGLAGSGVSEDGWDWSRPPGATVTHIPLEKIPYESIIMMPTTNESFVGNIHLENQDGMFAMVLREKPEPSRPDIGLHAKKSYSFFGDTIVCLGSSITSPSKKYPVETVLFQQHLKSRDIPIAIDGKTTGQFPFSLKKSTATFLRDTVGHHYHIPDGQNLHVARQHQNSYYHYAQRKDASKNYKDRDAANQPTEGDYSIAWLDHGIGSTTPSYHYAVLVYPNEERATQWQANPGYSVLQHDDSAHVVRNKHTTTFAIFETSLLTAQTTVTDTSAPCLIMTKEDGDTLKLNLTDPDLRLPGNEGGSIPGEIFVPDGNGPEISTVRVTLNGRYSLISGTDATISTKKHTTTLTFQTKRGRTYTCELLKK